MKESTDVSEDLSIEEEMARIHNDEKCDVFCSDMYNPLSKSAINTTNINVHHLSNEANYIDSEDGCLDSPTK